MGRQSWPELSFPHADPLGAKNGKIERQTRKLPKRVDFISSLSAKVEEQICLSGSTHAHHTTFFELLAGESICGLSFQLFIYYGLIQVCFLV